MNQSHPEDSAEPGEHSDFLELVMRYQDGTLSSAGVEQLSNMLRQDASKRKQFRDIQLRTAAIHDLFRMDAFAESRLLRDERDEQRGSKLSSRVSLLGRFISRRRYSSMLSVCLLVLVAVYFWPGSTEQPENQATNQTTAATEHVLLIEEDSASFFDSNPPEPGEAVELDRDYLLHTGLVKLQFPLGASAIIEAPSIFRVATLDRLILNSGGCSVHAPPGAEGFEVITPLTKVVDRGTRFYVNVQANSETEIHVIEGAADLYPIKQDESDNTATAGGTVAEQPLRLRDGQAVQVGGFVPGKMGQQTTFDPQRYRGTLPDRLMAYEATSTSNGTADELLSVTVQRQGRAHKYAVSDLIPVQVTAFRGSAQPEKNGHLCGFRQLPARPEDWMEDRKLQTGLINFGGQEHPMPNIPVTDNNTLNVAEAPPGLGIRFRTPIVNHAGPDLLLFEIQSFVNDPVGDPFHIYPVSSRDDLHPFTVTRFDLTLNSPGLRKVAPLWSHRYPDPVHKLDDIRGREAPVVVDVGHLHFHIIGVGIDLSDMGYADGESVSELFLQHASPDENVKIDPVLITGLPPLTPDN